MVSEKNDFFVYLQNRIKTRQDRIPLMNVGDKSEAMETENQKQGNIL